MNPVYPTAEGPLLEAVKRVATTHGGFANEELWAEYSTAREELVKLCPHKPGDIMKANGHSFDGRGFRVSSIEVESRPHYPSHTMFQKESMEYYWILRGPLMLANGTVSEVNSAMRFETFHVSIPRTEPISGDMCW